MVLWSEPLKRCPLIFWVERPRSFEYVCIRLLPYFDFLNAKLTRQSSWQTNDNFQQGITCLFRLPNCDLIPLRSLCVRGLDRWHPSLRQRSYVRTYQASTERRLKTKLRNTDKPPRSRRRLIVSDVILIQPLETRNVSSVSAENTTPRSNPYENATTHSCSQLLLSSFWTALHCHLFHK